MKIRVIVSRPGEEGGSSSAIEFNCFQSAGHFIRKTLDHLDDQNVAIGITLNDIFLPMSDWSLDKEHNLVVGSSASLLGSARVYH